NGLYYSIPCTLCNSARTRSCYFFFLLPRRPPISTLFPYTTLFRSVPVLEIEPGTHLPESNAILWYLADGTPLLPSGALPRAQVRSEEHTSELQSRGHLVCRLLLEKKK